VKDRIVVTSETHPPFIVGPEGLAEAFRVFWDIKHRYDYAKRGIFMEIFWVLVISWMMYFGEYTPTFGPLPLKYILTVGLIFWGVCLYRSVRSIYIYKSRYHGDEMDMFMEELRKQPWR